MIPPPTSAQGAEPASFPPGGVKAVLLAAGEGRRLAGGAAPRGKATLRLGGHSALCWAVSSIARSGVVEELVVVLNERDRARTAHGICGCAGDVAFGGSHPGPAILRTVPGGLSRSASLERAARELRGARQVLVHEVARCLTPPECFRALAEHLRRGPAFVCGEARIPDAVVNRPDPPRLPEVVFRGGQASVMRGPFGYQAEVFFHFRQLDARDARLGLPARTDLEKAAHTGTGGTTMPAHPLAMKLTYPQDVPVFDLLAGALAGRHGAEGALPWS